MTAYYNEIDPFAAQWLRNLINAGHIAPGIVDERSIEDVYPSDLRGFTQCHFFAGIGVWSHALRSAGWSDDRPVWTGSCPCQPFSAAGKGAGFDDERHLWPAFHHLIKECRPAIVLGEQVASKDADPWIDLVCDDVEGMDYAFGAVPFPSAGVGAPHIRDRLYWVADSNGGTRGKGRAHLRGRPSGGDAQSRAGLGGSGLPRRLSNNDQHGCGALPISQCDHTEHHAEPCGQPGRMDNSDQAGLAGHGRGETAHRGQEHSVRPARRSVGTPSPTGGLAYARHDHDAGEDRAAGAGQSQAIGPADQPGGRGAPLGAGAGPVHGFWAAADWLLCRDGRWRPVEPGTFPLVDGPAARVGQRGADWHAPAGPEGIGHRAGRLKGYGNAINAEAARVFIECVMDSL